MFSSQINSRYIKQTTNRICQGDILREIRIIETVKQTVDELEVIEKNLPYAVVLTQDCDLEQDHFARTKEEEASKPKDHDKYLISVLLCPAYPAEIARVGEHLLDQQFRMQKINSDRYKRIKQNDDPRYHFIHEDTNYQLPELIIDFKHYYSMPKDELLLAKSSGSYLVTMSELFRESFSRRFSNYLSRIALPEFKE